MEIIDVSVVVGEAINSNRTQGCAILIHHCDDETATGCLDPSAVVRPEIAFAKQMRHVGSEISQRASRRPNFYRKASLA